MQNCKRNNRDCKDCNAAITNAKINDLSASKINTGTLSARIATGSLDIGGKAIQDSIGRISGAAGNDVTMTSLAEIFQGNFAAPHHIAATTLMRCFCGRCYGRKPNI